VGENIRAMKTECNAEELNLIKLAKEYSDEDKARELLESMRWPDGASCPHCKAKEPYALKPRATSTRPGRKGLYKCRACRKQFTVTVGTVFEDSHIPISKWLMAIFILCSSKKAVSAHQLHRMLDMTYKSAWFMAHRIRYAMSPGKPLGEMLKGTVEADETYVGGRPRFKNNADGKREKPGGTGYRCDTNKIPVVALVERDGNVRTKVVANVNQDNLRDFLRSNIARGARVNTDQAAIYRNLFYGWTKHDVVNHSVKEYFRVNTDGTLAHTNTVESFFSLIKRGIYGAFHHVSRQHLHRYCDEFAFRWNHRRTTDGARMAKAVKVVEGKRLMYRKPKN